MSQGKGTITVHIEKLGVYPEDTYAVRLSGDIEREPKHFAGRLRTSIHNADDAEIGMWEMDAILNAIRIAIADVVR